MTEGTGMSGVCEGRGKAGGTRKRLIGDRAVIPGGSRFILAYRARERELVLVYYTITVTKNACIPSCPSDKDRDGARGNQVGVRLRVYAKAVSRER